jgi:hypothetical protein
MSIRFFVTNVIANAKPDQIQATAKEVVISRDDEVETFSYMGEPIELTGVPADQSVAEHLKIMMRSRVGEGDVIATARSAAEVLDIFQGMEEAEQNNVRIQEPILDIGVLRFIVPVTAAERDVVLEALPLQATDDDILIVGIASTKDTYLSACVYTPGGDIDGVRYDRTTQTFEPWQPQGRIDQLMDKLENRFPKPADMAI